MRLRLRALLLMPALLAACSGSRHAVPDQGSNSSTASSYSTGVPMAVESFRFSARPNGPIPPLVAGAVSEIAFVIKNESSLTWPGKALAETDRTLSAAYHVLNQNREVVMFDGFRTLITADVPHGREIVITLRVKAPETPGRYRLQPDVLPEYVAWFGVTSPPKNNPPVAIEVKAAQ